MFGRLIVSADETLLKNKAEVKRERHFMKDGNVFFATF